MEQSKIAALPVLLVHTYENGKVVDTAAQMRAGTKPRTDNFYHGAWKREDGSLFFVMEDGRFIEEATPGALVEAVLKVKKGSEPLRKVA